MNHFPLHNFLYTQSLVSRLPGVRFGEVGLRRSRQELGLRANRGDLREGHFAAACYLFQFYNWSHLWVKAWDRKEEAKPGIQSHIDFSSRADFLPQFEYYFFKIFPRLKVVSKKFLF